MNSAIETELRSLLDNVNKTLALNMSTKHGLDYDEVYEFLTVSMNENKAPSSRGRPKKEKKTVTENHKDSTGKPDVNYIIKEMMEKDAELEELSEDEIDGDAGEETSVLASSPKSSKKDKTEKKVVEKTEKKEKPKVEKTEKKEKPKEKKDDDKSKAEKAEAAEKVKADKAAAAEKVKIEKAEAAEKVKADKAAAKAAAKTTTEKKPKGKGKEKEKEEEKKEKTEVAAAVEASAEDDDDDDEGMNVCEITVDGKVYLRQEFGTKLFDPETNEEIGDWDEKNNKIIKA